MSGSGKTTIARGLMALLTARGMTVQPFKCGPDYIDTKFHAAVCGRPSVNLDTFMASPEHVRELFARYAESVDVCIVEGMMGLFDGYDRERGSSYEIARVLGLPVVLVVDAKSAAYSMAALLSGYVNFRSDIRFAGVIFNKVGSEKHARMLRQVSEDLQLPCLGCLPRAASLDQASRYLGLDFSQEPETAPLVALLAEHLDLDRLLAVVGNASQRCEIVGHASLRDECRDSVTLGSVTHYGVTHYAPQPRFVDTSQYISIRRDKLPHWQQSDSMSFVTFRLADSLPQTKLQELQAFKDEWLSSHPLPWDDETKDKYDSEVRRKTEHWLDEGYGSCLLGRPDIRQLVADALMHNNGSLYWLHQYVIMPNHVHLLLTPINDHSITKSIGAVKQFTATSINRAMGTCGRVWQPLVFDHLVRNDRQYERFVNYINNNPAHLPASAFTLYSAVVGNASQRCSHAGKHDPLSCHAGKHDPLQHNPLRTLVAHNAESFSFIYQETIDAMGHVRFFDPETEVPTLDDVDLLYLPGGYPEKHLEALAGNEACRQTISDFAERGGRIIAECGGMMYLCKNIITDDGEFPMCGVLPYDISARKTDRRLSLGYRSFVLDGREYRGHEFHYTQFVPPLPPTATQVYDAQGQPVATPILRYKNALASYTHLYLNETNLY